MCTAFPSRNILNAFVTLMFIFFFVAPFLCHYLKHCFNSFYLYAYANFLDFCPKSNIIKYSRKSRCKNLSLTFINETSSSLRVLQHISYIFKQKSFACCCSSYLICIIDFHWDYYWLLICEIHIHFNKAIFYYFFQFSKCF